MIWNGHKRANQNPKWKENFNTEGDVKVFKEDGYEVSAGTVQNAVETKLEEKGKELVGLRAFDITILLPMFSSEYP